MGVSVTILTGALPGVSSSLLLFLVLEQLLDLVSHIQEVIMADLSILQMLTGLQGEREEEDQVI